MSSSPTGLKSALQHPATRRHLQVSFRMDESVSGGIFRKVEQPRHQYLQTVIQPPFLPILTREAKQGIPAVDRFHIHADPRFEIFIKDAQHLIRLMDFDRPLFKSV